MDNIELFEYSLKNTEHIFDDANKKEKIIITKDAHKTNKPIKNNERLIGLITSYQTMRGKLSKKQEDDLVGEIDSILFNNSHMNYTAFAQYLMVWDMPYSSLSCEREEDRMPLLRELINKYINDRHQMYLSHGYSNIVLQVLADNYSHKRAGKTGVSKIAALVESAGFKRIINELINASCDNKMSKAKRDIYRYLRQNKNNYFVNTAGFIRLLKTIK